MKSLANVMCVWFISNLGHKSWGLDLFVVSVLLGDFGSFFWFFFLVFWFFLWFWGGGFFLLFCVLGGCLGFLWFCLFVCLGFFVCLIGVFSQPLFPCFTFSCSRRSSERELSSLIFPARAVCFCIVSFMVMMKDCPRRGRYWEGVERTIKFREVFPVLTPQQKLCPLFSRALPYLCENPRSLEVIPCTGNVTTKCPAHFL